MNRLSKSQIKQFLKILIGIIFTQFGSACTKYIYIEDLSAKFEPVRTVDMYILGTPTNIYHTNAMNYEQGYFVNYNKFRVIWYPNRFSYNEISIPINQVSQITYRSRLRGILAGIAAGYLLGYGAFNLGILDKAGQPFLSQTNQAVSLGFASVFAVGGFFSGIPVKYKFVHKNKKARIAKDFIINPNGEY